MTRSQRWRDRRATLVADTSVINTDEFSVDVIACHGIAKPFIAAHHYSGTMPATRLSIGLFRNGRGGRSELAGVCSFSVPMNNASIKLHTGLDDHLAAVDLGRLVLLDDVAGNGESFFVSRALKLLRREKPNVVSVIAYSDPVPRLSAEGVLTMPGHVGMVYQALSAVHRGRSTPRTNLVMPNGQIASSRAIAKLTVGDTGAAYAERQLVDAGCPLRQTNEEPLTWIARLRTQGVLTTQRHNGNHVYVFEMTRRARHAAAGLARNNYPVRDPACDGDVTALPLLAHAA